VPVFTLESSRGVECLVPLAYTITGTPMGGRQPQLAITLSACIDGGTLYEARYYEHKNPIIER